MKLLHQTATVFPPIPLNVQRLPIGTTNACFFLIDSVRAVATYLDQIDMGIDIDGFLHEVHVERIPKTFHGMAVRVFR